MEKEEYSSPGGCHEEDTDAEDGEAAEAEWKKVGLMRAYVEGQDPAAKEVDNFMLRRFLRARDLDIGKASTMFLKYLKWRREAVPNGVISDEEVQNELAQKKIFFQGHDKKGRPIGVGFGSKHYSSKRNMDELKRFVVYILDKMCSRIPSGQEKFVGIADLAGWGYSNCDIRAYLAALDIMQAWKMVYPFIDDKTKKKFVFVDDKNLKSTLLADIDENQLPDIYGGKLKLVAIDE